MFYLEVDRSRRTPDGLHRSGLSAMPLPPLAAVWMLLRVMQQTHLRCSRPDVEASASQPAAYATTIP